MANIRLIKRRIKSAQNISQITKAMEMVAASKMKKAQDQALLSKPYTQKILEAVKDLGGRVDKSKHPLLSSGNPNGKILIVLLSTNKGLCGGLNTNLFRMVLSHYHNEKSLDFISVGKKSENFVIRYGKNLIADFSQKVPFKENVPALTDLVINEYIKGYYKQVYLVYNSFINALKQTPTIKIILPISDIDISEKTTDEKKYNEFLIEPSVGEVLNSLLPHFIENQIRSAIAEAEASEHSARMIAMKNATEAALDFVEELTLVYNKARQEKITYEIADMVTARMAFD